MEDRFLSRFTPSLMSPDALEAIFVQREGLLHDILERVKASVVGSEKQNTLLVGPRGIGKTHLISLTYYRLRSNPAIRDRILIAWLREEEWGIACFRDLLLRILRALVPDDSAQLRSIYSLPPAAAETAALKLIDELVGDRTLVILVENLDDLLRKLGGPGEMQFYNFLRRGRSCCVVATSPGPTARVFAPASPFRRDLFQIHLLRELDFETAIQLIAKIAEYQDNKELMFLIATPRGRARVRALRYLAGGNHRAYVIFSPLLIHESIGQLIQPLMQTIDILTPYYNSRIAALPWEQRQILEYICEVRRAVRSGEITRTCFLPRSAASAQLEALCSMGHLHALRVGNDMYYELREPLLRLSFEVKKHRGKPLGLLLDFLRLWYSPEELKKKLSNPANAAAERLHIPDLEAIEQKWDDPRIAECCRDYADAVRRDDIEQALKFAEDLVSLRGLLQDRMAQASCLVRLGRHDHALAVCDHIIDSGEGDASSWRLRASVLNAAGRYEEALSSCRKALELDKDSSDTWNCEALILRNLGHNEEALYSCEAALKLNESDSFAWATLGTVLAGMDLYDESFRAYSKVVELEPHNAQARMHLCAALIEMNRWNEALEQAKAILNAVPNGPEPWVLIGSVLAGIGEKKDALAAFEKAASLGDNSAYVQFKVVEMLFASGRWRDAASYLDKALESFARSDSPITGDTKTLIRSLLSSCSDARILVLLIKVLLLIYGKYHVTGVLAQGLIVCIPDVAVSDAISNEEASTWLDSWKTMAADHLEFRLPLRLLSAAIAYRNTRDMSVMIRLSQEERTLLEALVGIQVEAIA